MIVISHRGLLHGSDSAIENVPWNIDIAIDMCKNVEVDVWVSDGKLYLGHDAPKTNVTWKWLDERALNLWIHCKNTEAIYTLNDYGDRYHYFWHENDVMTLTSKQYMWVFPGKQPVKNSIAVLPEIYGENTTMCAGICTDYVVKYMNYYNL
jgi:hypothetical protein